MTLSVWDGHGKVFGILDKGKFIPNRRCPEEIKKLVGKINESYMGKPCYLCGRSYPEVMLNIEGYIHHGEMCRCLDTKNCRRAVRKLKRKKV